MWGRTSGGCVASSRSAAPSLRSGPAGDPTQPPDATGFHGRKQASGRQRPALRVHGDPESQPPHLVFATFRRFWVAINTHRYLSADSDFSPPLAPHFVSFARHYHRFALLRSPGAGRFPVGLDHFYRGARAASSRWRRRDLPGSWTTLAYMPRSSTPADPRPQATTGPAMWSSAL